MRRDVDGAQIAQMIGSVIGFVFAHRNASAELLDFGLEARKWRRVSLRPRMRWRPILGLAGGNVDTQHHEHENQN